MLKAFSAALLLFALMTGQAGGQTTTTLRFEVTRELIPTIENLYRGIGTPSAHVLDGASTGGWVSFALQIFYPDFFNGTWSSSPDPLDFRAYQLIDIYKDKNAYVNPYGFERPSERTILGETRFTMRHEVQTENVRGDADNYFLNNAVHFLDASLSKSDPPFVGEIVYGPNKGHTWYGITDRQILDQMLAATQSPGVK